MSMDYFYHNFMKSFLLLSPNFIDHIWGMNATYSLSSISTDSNSDLSNLSLVSECSFTYHLPVGSKRMPFYFQKLLPFHMDPKNVYSLSNVSIK